VQTTTTKIKIMIKILKIQYLIDRFKWWILL